MCDPCHPLFSASRRHAVILCWVVIALLAPASEQFPDRPGNSSDSVDESSGGKTTVFDATRQAYSLPAPNLSEAHRTLFFVGNSFFNQNWLIAPSSTAARDGLGPLFNARSCSGCHFKDGRGRPPEASEAMSTMVLRISVPGTNAVGGPCPETVYGDQIQNAGIPGVRPEADVLVDYEIIEGRFNDGDVYSLRKPVVRLRAPGYGPPTPGLLTSARVAPAMIGLGLLEAIPESTLRDLADPEDRNGDGISGRLNLVWDSVARRYRAGRFGWKAEQPTILQQSAGAFREDIGITSSIFPADNLTPAQGKSVKQPNGGSPEIDDSTLRAVALYASTLAVPARRDRQSSSVQQGEALFRSIGCAACHIPRLQTGEHPEVPELSHQVIQPFTDLLLHDLGAGLSDQRPAFRAGGEEWRTPPLWGLGLLKKVNGHTFLLHDGRARNVAEAILWHDGEAGSSQHQFQQLSRENRNALVAFLESL